MAAEKQFKPTKRKLERARREGRVSKAPVCTQFCLFLAAVTMACLTGPRVFVGPRMLLEYAFAEARPSLAQASVFAADYVFHWIIIVLAVSAGGALLSEFMQVGFKIEPTPVAPRWDRLNIVRGFARISSSVKQSWEGIFRAVLIAAAGLLVLTRTLNTLVVTDAVVPAGVAALKLLAILILGILGAGAGADLLLRRRAFMRDLSMDHNEMREEAKEVEGSPLMKALRRAVHESILMQDLERRVRRSKVIVVRRGSHKDHR